MKIIDFEGLDKSGKNTQSNMLYDYLVSKGYKVYKTEFHRYDTETGKLIRKWLDNEYFVDQITIELIMTADKQAQQNFFKELEKEGYDYLILDRYTWSQKVYSSATNPFKGFAQSAYQTWIENISKYIREPDYIIYLDVPVEESMKRKGQHGANDRYESDKELLHRVREEYLDMITGNIFSDNSYFRIDGFQPPEEVWENVKDVFDLNIEGDK